jgi:hypothetical protein
MEFKNLNANPQMTAGAFNLSRSRIKNLDPKVVNFTTAKMATIPPQMAPTAGIVLPGMGMLAPAMLPPTTAPPASKEPAPTTPTNTLYIRNLNEKIKIMGTSKRTSLIIWPNTLSSDLKKTLYAIFSPYGEILQIEAKKNVVMRGQAFVVFKSVESTIRALEELQHFPLFNKSIV